jgi:hypothetical protein
MNSVALPATSGGYKGERTKVSQTTFVLIIRELIILRELLSLPYNHLMCLVT